MAKARQGSLMANIMFVVVHCSFRLHQSDDDADDVSSDGLVR